MSAATVSRLVDDLISEGLVAEGAAVASGRIGRAAISLHVNAAQGLVCGVDLGGSNCRAVLADLLGRPLRHTQLATPAQASADKLADWVAGIVRRLASRHRPVPLVAVVAGLPGIISPDGRMVTGAPNLPQIEGEAFAARLGQRLGVPSSLDNDSNLALLGEMRFGAARGRGTVVMITIGTGVGAGVAVDGSLLTGRTGQVGEFGFLPAGPNGESLEHLISGTGLVRQARDHGYAISRAEDLFSESAPDSVRPVLSGFRRALLLLLAMSATAYDPEVIVIGGGVAPAIARELPDLEAELKSRLPTAPQLAVSVLGSLGGALGAMAAACQLTYTRLGVDPARAVSLPGPAALDDFPAKAHPGEAYVPATPA